MSTDEAKEVLDDIGCNARFSALNISTRLMILIIVELRKIAKALQDKGAI